MSASLVGSEMCIRDRCLQPASCVYVQSARAREPAAAAPHGAAPAQHPVSYTHLTLPTICSV
eukprot:8384786-Alexandrium_andersonii.AAC.1